MYTIENIKLNACVTKRSMLTVSQRYLIIAFVKEEWATAQTHFQRMFYWSGYYNFEGIVKD